MDKNRARNAQEKGAFSGKGALLSALQKVAMMRRPICSANEKASDIARDILLKGRLKSASSRETFSRNVTRKCHSDHEREHRRNEYARERKTAAMSITRTPRNPFRLVRRSVPEQSHPHKGAGEQPMGPKRNVSTSDGTTAWAGM